MMGHLNGMAKRIKDEESTAINVHCFVHSLNLCLQDAAKQCSPVRNALDMAIEIIKLIKYSPKRSLIFEKCKQDLSHPVPSHKPLFPTRWTVKTKAIDAVLRNYATLMETLETISSECRDDYQVKEQMVFVPCYNVLIRFLCWNCPIWCSVLQNKHPKPFKPKMQRSRKLSSLQILPNRN